MSREPSARRGVRALFALVVVSGVLVGAELAGRVGYGVLDRARSGELPRKGLLRPYEIDDPKRPGNWMPRPGYTMTLTESRKLVQDEGLVLAQQVLEHGASRLGIPDDRVIFHVNADGYKGPELDRSGARARILAIGDSCTFGSLFDYYAWPRAAERALAELGARVEVVNAGVNGYSPAHALARLDEFRALRPRIAVLYIGWNAIFGDWRAVRDEHFALRRLLGTLRTLWWMRGKSAQEIALASYHAPKRPDPAAAELARLEGYRPDALADVAALVRGLDAGGAQVAIATLPGLYVEGEAASARALEIGHLPQFTDNPYVIAALAHGYNDGLREQAAELGAQLVDLERWSRSALAPRDAYFTDSVHLTEEGQERIGAEIARAIAPALADRRGDAPEGG